MAVASWRTFVVDEKERLSRLFVVRRKATHAHMQPSITTAHRSNPDHVAEKHSAMLLHLTASPPPRWQVEAARRECRMSCRWSVLACCPCSVEDARILVDSRLECNGQRCWTLRVSVSPREGGRCGWSVWANGGGGCVGNGQCRLVVSRA